MEKLAELHLQERVGDRIFRITTLAFGGVSVLMAVAFGFKLFNSSRLAWKQFGLSFLWTSTWDPVMDVFGALPFIYGTLVTSFIALLIAVPLGVGSAIFLAEMAPKKVADVITFLIELLAAIPSVILGLIGIFVLVPFMKSAGTPYGVGMLTAGIILSIMILPYITTISRDVIMAVPRPLREAALGLGATRWETIGLVVLPYARSAILGAIFLGLGRALGETMAVTMVIGNTSKISLSLLDPAYTMSAVLANEFAEATSDMHTHSLIAIALVLFFITIIVNGLARAMIYNLGSKVKPR